MKDLTLKRVKDELNVELDPTRLDIDTIKHQAIILLDNKLKVIRANRTVELWGWAKVKDVHGIHVLSLITPAIEYDTNNDWINEWCQLDTQSEVEWISNNCQTGKMFRFSYFPNKAFENNDSNNDYYAIMLITDISKIS